MDKCMHMQERCSERSSRKAHIVEIYEFMHRRIWRLTGLVSLVLFVDESRLARKQATLIDRRRAGPHFTGRSSHYQINVGRNMHTQPSSLSELRKRARERPRPGLVSLAALLRIARAPHLVH